MSSCCNRNVTTTLRAGDNLRFWLPNQGNWYDASLTTLVEFLSSGAFASLTASSYLRVSPVLVQNLPSAADSGAGARAFVTDASATTFHSIVAGGGANSVPVFSDATNWRIG
jgi:hypothetical protein